jgi:hypothetical protein
VASGACGQANVCLPALASGATTRVCVMQSGDAGGCPADYGSGPQVFYAGVDDQRGCNVCQCDSPAGGACTAGVVGCFPLTPATWPVSLDQCVSYNPANYLGVKLHAPPTVLNPGACMPKGGPTGAAVGTDATSVCCLP